MMKKLVIALLMIGLASSYFLFEHSVHDHDSHSKESHHSEHDHEEHDHNHEEDGHEDHVDETYLEHDKHDDEHDDHSGHEGHHDHSEHGEHNEADSIALEKNQLELAGIKIQKLVDRQIKYDVYAPGEVRSNSYAGYVVSPRVSSVVIDRHVSLGEPVVKNQPLVTLFSHEISQAQAQFLKVSSEWQRVQKLGRQTVGDKRYIDAKTNYEFTQSELFSYGLSKSDLQLLISDKQKVFGEYTLRAVSAGVVLKDAFERGQTVEPGYELMALGNNEKIWVEAQLPADINLNLDQGTSANILISGDKTFGLIEQVAPLLDPKTRAKRVRLVVDNSNGIFHPGQFAEVFFSLSTTKPVLTVPESALMRNQDGNWIIFVEGDHEGEFQAVTVNLGRKLGDLREISGVNPGTPVVMKGAFFVASQIAKGGFDPHNH